MYDFIITRMTYSLKTYLISWPKTVHGTDLMCGQRLTKQIDGGHLSTEDPLFVKLGSRAYVAFVERLATK